MRIHNYTLAQLVDYAKTVPLEEIEFIREAYVVNIALLEEGISNPRTTFAPQLKKMNGDQVISDDELKTAQLLCNAAIEARVIGLGQARYEHYRLWSARYYRHNAALCRV